jgi:hypothetical protein
LASVPTVFFQLLSVPRRAYAPTTSFATDSDVTGQREGAGTADLEPACATNDRHAFLDVDGGDEFGK